ncbi:unnamed protein product, partial [Rhizoctonia solani]
IAQPIRWEQWFGIIPSNQTGYLVELASTWEITESHRILELGCGQADCMAILASAIGDSGHITSLDTTSLDYGHLGTPTMLGQAQSDLLISETGHRISFVQADPIEFLSSQENQNAFDTAIVAHCMYYMSSHTTCTLLNNFRTLFSAPSIKEICVAEYALSASNANGYPHVLAVLAQAMIEVRKDSEKSESNVRTVLRSEGISKLASEAGWLVSREDTLVLEQDEGDGRREVGALLAYAEEKIAALIPNERERATINGIKGSVSRSVDKLGGLENVRTIDVWWRGLGTARTSR